MANGQLTKGSGRGTCEWREDFNLTQSDGVTPNFKVALANGNTTVAGTLSVSGAASATGGVTFGVGSVAAEGTFAKLLTPASTGTGTSAQVLQTSALTAGLLGATGQGVRITAWGSTAANGNNKTVSLTFGATTVATSGVLAANNSTWYLTAEVFRTGATTQSAVGSSQVGTAVQAVTVSSPAETLSGAVTVTMTGTDGTSSAGDITCTGMIVEYLS